MIRCGEKRTSLVFLVLENNWKRGISEGTAFKNSMLRTRRGRFTLLVFNPVFPPAKRKGVGGGGADIFRLLFVPLMQGKLLFPELAGAHCGRTAVGTSACPSSGETRLEGGLGARSLVVGGQGRGSPSPSILGPLPGDFLQGGLHKMNVALLRLLSSAQKQASEELFAACFGVVRVGLGAAMPLHSPTRRGSSSKAEGSLQKTGHEQRRSQELCFRHV